MSSNDFAEREKTKAIIFGRAAELMLPRQRTCITCELWIQNRGIAGQHFPSSKTWPTYPSAPEGCGLAQGARPPARVIALGCDAWIEDIPF